ncbi:MAG: delta-60 repeat domain-containing protein [Planctomycetota bacterium]
MNPHRPPFLLPLLFASLLPLPLRGQCGLGLQWQAGDPLGRVRGSVMALVNWDPDGAGPAPLQLVIGGVFDVGHATGAQLATWDGSQWTILAVPAFAAGITAMMVWNGQLVVAFGYASGGPALSSGNIYGYDGTTWTHFGSLALGPSSPPPPGRTNALVEYNGALVAVGDFNTINWGSATQLAASNVARFDGTSWSALGSGVPRAALCAAIFNGSLHVGGGFFAGTAAANLQAWNGSVWSPVGLWNGTVETLAVRNGTSATNSFLFAGGAFTMINGILSAPLVASFSPSTNSWSAIGSPGSGSAPTRCNDLFVRSTGNFTYELTAALENSTPQKVWRRAGTSWTPLGSVPSSVSRLGYYGGSYFGVDDSGLRRYDSPTNYWSRLLGPGLDDSVSAVCADGTEAVIGGAFTAISGVPMNGIARGHVGAWQPLGGGLTGGSGVFAVAKMPNGDVVAGGDFTFAGGQPANHIARWNGAVWAPLAAGTNGTVDALLPQSNGDLIVAGNFTSAGGVSANRIARWNGTSFVPLGAGTNGRIYALAQLQNGDIVAAGTFNIIFTGMSGIARWNGTTWSALGSGLNGPAYTLTVAQNGALWVGGAFQTLVAFWPPTWRVGTAAPGRRARSPDPTW